MCDKKCFKIAEKITPKKRINTWEIRKRKNLKKAKKDLKI